ncbi:MAG TPA: (Fe-S)-binding protein [Myxococcota bacterium]|nr:(Fe-S)-binding protein [Myxococcota bacterium]
METVTPFAEIVQEIKDAGGDAFKYCYQCGKCDVVCPWNRMRSFSIRKIIRQATFGLPEIELEDMWRCTTCGLCPSKCPRGVQQVEVGVSLRRIATSYEVFPTSVRGVCSAAASLRSDGNPLGAERDERTDWAAGLGLKPYAEGMEFLYFVGCYYSFDPRLQQVARATAELLKRAGVDFGVLGAKESCCGESIRKTGDEEVFKKLARENIKTFIDHGVKKILVSSPHCYHTFANEYPEFMVSFEVVHLTELLSRLVEEGRLELGAFDKKVTYHDPCYLGRHNGIYDPPRELLRRLSGLELAEMADNREESLCCGGGGGRIWMETPKGERFSDLRLEQAVDAGAEVLVTSCPYCISNFEDSRLSLEDGQTMEIKDLAEVLWESVSEGTP